MTMNSPSNFCSYCNAPLVFDSGSWWCSNGNCPEEHRACADCGLKHARTDPPGDCPEENDDE